MPVSNIGNHELTPTLQHLARDGVRVEHFNRVRRDRGFQERIARALKTGGWQLTRSEMEAFDLLGEEAMYLAPEVARVWLPECYHLDYGDWHKREVRYKSETVRTLMRSQRARLVNSASSGVASTEPETDWRLFYINGETLQSMIERMFQFHLPGLDREKLQAFLKAWPSSAFESVKSGYYLINVSPVRDYKWCNKDGRKDLSPLIMLEAHITHYLLREQWGFSEGNWGVCGFTNKPTPDSSALVELWGNRPSTVEPSGAFGINYWPKGPQTLGTMAMVEHDIPFV